MVGIRMNHTLESCKESALKYSTKAEWKKADPKSYGASKFRGWYDECTKHIEKKYTLESCKESALKHKTKYEWRIADVNSYSASCRNGWYEECCKHMESKRVK
jgi:hypothetical protein